MTWFKVDDSFYDHPKVEELSLAARGLWVTAGSYCARHLTDGFVPLSVVSRSGRGSANVASTLVQCGLWRRVEGGFQFHDWDQFQPSREAVQQERSRTKERQQAWRDRKRNGVTNTSRNGVTNSARGDGAPTRPDPTLSLPTLSQASAPGVAAGSTAKSEREGSLDTNTPRQLAATLLGVAADDPRLDGLPALLKSYQVRAPNAWLRAAAAKGDLEALLDGPAETDPWAHLPKNPPPPPDGVPRPAHTRTPNASTERTAP